MQVPLAIQSTARAFALRECKDSIAITVMRGFFFENYTCTTIALECHGYFGYGCLAKCPPCVTSNVKNPLDCHPMTGACECLPGFTGVLCADGRKIYIIDFLLVQIINSSSLSYWKVWTRLQAVVQMQERWLRHSDRSVHVSFRRYKRTMWSRYAFLLLNKQYSICLFVLVCPKGYFGENCQYQCACDHASQVCDGFTGECSCDPGWQPPMCVSGTTKNDFCKT